MGKRWPPVPMKVVKEAIKDNEGEALENALYSLLNKTAMDSHYRGVLLERDNTMKEQKATINDLLENKDTQTSLTIKRAGPRRVWNRDTRDFDNLPPKHDITIMHIKIEDPTTGLKYEVKQEVSSILPEFQEGGIGINRVVIELESKLKL